MSAACFVDTFALLAALNPRDARHGEVVSWLSASRRPLATTEWVLTELADGMCLPRQRNAVLGVERRLRADARVTIIESSVATFRRGWDLYAARPDKEWSLTDCISFVVMRERGISEALTADHHFEQAGFVALLK